MKNILVVFGGKSCEHDISVITGVLTLNSIDKENYNAIAVYVTNDGVWYHGEVLNDLEWYKTKNFKLLDKVSLIQGSDFLYTINKNKLKPLMQISCAINCLHGLNGEDGSLSGLLNLCDIPLASPDMFTSSFSIDKDITKIVLKGLGINYLPYLRIFKECFFSKKDFALKMIEGKLSYPVIIKPARLGSSIGIKVANNIEQLEESLITAFSYDNKVIVEKALSNFIEINCSVYKSFEDVHISQLERPFKEKEILSFKDKYLENKNLPKKEFPAKIDKKIAEQITKISEKVYRKCCFTGIIRIDFLVENNVVYLNEINTVPGSLAYYLHCKSTTEFKDLLSSLIEDAISSFKKQKALKRVYNSGILNIKGIKGKR